MGDSEVWLSGGRDGPSGNDQSSSDVYSWRGPGTPWRRRPNLLCATNLHDMVWDGQGIWVFDGSWSRTLSVLICDSEQWEVVSLLRSTLFNSGSVCWGPHIITLGGAGHPDEVLVTDTLSGTTTQATTTLPHPVWSHCVALIMP